MVDVLLNYKGLLGVLLVFVLHHLVMKENGTHSDLWVPFPIKSQSVFLNFSKVWPMFMLSILYIHKKRNRLLHKRLNYIVFVPYDVLDYIYLVLICTTWLLCTPFVPCVVCLTGTRLVVFTLMCLAGWYSLILTNVLSFLCCILCYTAVIQFVMFM